MLVLWQLCILIYCEVIVLRVQVVSQRRKDGRPLTPGNSQGHQSPISIYVVAADVFLIHLWVEISEYRGGG